MKKSKFILFIACSTLLASCGIEHPDLPSDYDQTFFEVKSSDGSASISFNLNRRYYEAIGSTNEAALNYLLDTIASELTQGKVRDRDDDNNYVLKDTVLNMYSSSFDDYSATDNDVVTSYVSGLSDDGNSFNKVNLTFKSIKGEVTERSQKEMLSKVNGGSYDTNSRFDELKFAISLNSDSLAGINITDLDNYKTSQKVVNKTTSYSNVFTEGKYDDYITQNVVPSIIRNKLTAQYIYNKRYSSILNSDMRNVDIVALTDISDNNGAAIALINAYMQRLGTSGVIDAKYQEHPLQELAKLWKGIGGYSDKTDTGNNYEYALDYLTNEFVDSEEELSTEEKKFLSDNKLSNLYDEILDNLDRIDLANPLITDSDLQSTYTGSGAYGLKEGTKRQIDALRKKDIFTTGIYQKSDSDVSSLPSGVLDQLYNSNMDNTTTTINSYTFVTPEAQASTSDVAIYDQSSDTYYVVMINGGSKGIYNSSYLGSATENASSGHEEQKAAAMNVAYNLVSSSTYKTDATVYWLQRYFGKDFTVNNETFHTYLKGSYPNLFPDDD